MSYEIIRTSQFKKDYKLMQRRGKDKRKLEEILPHIGNFALCLTS